MTLGQVEVTPLQRHRDEQQPGEYQLRLVGESIASRRQCIRIVNVHESQQATGQCGHRQTGDTQLRVGRHDFGHERTVVCLAGKAQSGQMQSTTCPADNNEVVHQVSDDGQHPGFCRRMRTAGLQQDQHDCSQHGDEAKPLGPAPF